MKPCSPEDIDALLPQTQCGLCGYGGCMPYAKAMAFQNAPIHLCPPGGITTLESLGKLLEKDIAPFINEMQEKAKPTMLAVVREAECIGCTKCIKACPVDAIIGSAKSMHVVLSDACTGCELCIPPCPVDCIDLVPATEEQSMQHQIRRDLARLHFHRRIKRLEKEAEKAEENPSTTKSPEKNKQLQSYIAAALDRVKKK